MKKISNKESDDQNLNQFSASLNFAFCPLKALIASKKLIEEEEEFKLILKNHPDVNSEYLLNSFRYFYICYSLKIPDIDKECKNYFYFQLFSQIGDQQSPISPIYGFYSNDQILSMIKDIDNIFHPEMHERQIFESYVDELSGGADELIKLMQDWTSLKLIQFNNFYFQDEHAVSNLYKFLENFEKNSKKTKITKKKSSAKSKRPKTKKEI